MVEEVEVLYRYSFELVGFIGSPGDVTGGSFPDGKCFVGLEEVGRDWKGDCRREERERRSSTGEALRFVCVSLENDRQTNSEMAEEDEERKEKKLTSEND